MKRFLVTALPALLLLLATAAFVSEALGYEAGPGPLVGGGRGALPGLFVLAGWLLEAVALTALYLMIGGPRRGFVDGLLAGWIAWVFRGPLLVLSVVAWTGEPASLWWGITLRWWIAYTLAGILLAILGRRLKPPA